jgi:hypothetical protein
MKNMSLHKWGWAFFNSARQSALPLPVFALQNVPWWLNPATTQVNSMSEALDWAARGQLDFLIVCPDDCFISEKHLFIKFILDLIACGEACASISDRQGQGVQFFALNGKGSAVWPVEIESLFCYESRPEQFQDPGRFLRRRRVFYWNTEGMTDVDDLPTTAGVNTFHLVAAGLKSFKIIDRVGAESDVQVSFYDVNPDSLLFFKTQYEQWDGEDYPDFIAWAERRLKTNAEFSIPEPSDPQSRWDGFLSSFGGPSRWREFWRVYRKAKVTFTQVNILADPAALSRFPVGDTHLTWISNILNIPQVNRFSLPELIHLHTNLLSYLEFKANSYFVGQDFFHTRYSGLFTHEMRRQIDLGFDQVRMYLDGVRNCR